MFRDIALTAGGDLLTPWIDQFNTASENSTKLLNAFYDAPNVGLQQMVANISGYLQDFFNDPSSINASLAQFQDNLDAVVTGYALQNADAATTSIVRSHALDAWGYFSTSGHNKLFGEIPGYIPADEQASAIPIINFLASPASGIIMGDLGPFISPWVALFNSITAGDTFNETLANVTGAFFNGADLNLDSLIPAINNAGLFPPGLAVFNLDIGFGGLLSPGSVGSSDVAGEGGVGGSIFNSVGITLNGAPVVGSIVATSQPIGPLGALEGWAQTIASLLGWSGSGSPLADTTLPIIPDDDGGAAASLAADLPTWWQDLVAAL